MGAAHSSQEVVQVEWAYVDVYVAQEVIQVEYIPAVTNPVIGIHSVNPRFVSSTILPPVSEIGVNGVNPSLTPNIIPPVSEIGVIGVDPSLTPNVIPPVSKVGIGVVGPSLTPNIISTTSVIGVGSLLPQAKNIIWRSQSVVGSYVNLAEVFNILTPLGVTLDQLINTPIAEIEIQLIINELSSYIIGIQSILNRLTTGDPFIGIQELLSSVQSETICQSIINDLSYATTKIQALRTTLSESFTSRSSLINELALKDDIQSLIAVIGSLSEQTALYPACTMNVYLNGEPVIRHNCDLSITMDRESLFDTISFNSVDELFYAKMQTAVDDEDSVLEVQYKGTSWSFLVETLTGHNLSFSVWGRSIAAKSDTPFKDSLDYVLETETLASDLADILVPDLAITWNVVDWKVPVGWSTRGTPVQMLQDLASSVGAIVRMFPDGTGLYVDKRYPTRPVALPFATAIEYFDENINLLALASDAIIGTKVNAVTVYGHSPLSYYSITLEADSCVNVGNVAEIRVYPALGGVGYVLEASDGVPAYQYKKTANHTETVTFIGGKGSVRYPIVNLESILWDGAIPSGFDYSIGQNEIILTDDTLAAIGEVSYSTSYDVWNATHSGVGHLVVIYLPEEGSGVVAKVYFNDGDREAEDLDRPTLTTIEALVAAGTAHLDNTSYTKLLRNIKIPCSGVLDGDIISIHSESSGVTGNAFVMEHVISANMEGDVFKVYSDIKAVQFEA